MSIGDVKHSYRLSCSVAPPCPQTQLADHAASCRRPRTKDKPGRSRRDMGQTLLAALTNRQQHRQTWRDR
ncbi:unnamed protein product [Boreogadus saida]